MSWNTEGMLKFGVYSKPNQTVKYLNIDSHHVSSQKSAVLFGVKLRLSALTTRMVENSEVSLSNLYPINHEALLVAGQLKPGSKMRTLGTILDTEVLLQPQCFTSGRCINDQ